MSQSQLQKALAALRNGGVIAYPTEYCFGLGCDPANEDAVRRILAIKQRDQAQGLILVAANEDQVSEYAELEGLARYSEIVSSWPGPTTWLLPTKNTTPKWICGQHESIAMRVSSHPLVNELCTEFGGALVSTSANRHSKPALLSSSQVRSEMGAEVDVIIDGDLGDSSGQRSASSIIDAISGEQFR